MPKIKFSLSVLLVAFSFFSNSQISLSDIRNSGIKSEADLINLGVSKAEIQSLKTEIFKDQTGSTTLANDGEVKPKEVTGPVNNEIEISIPTPTTTNNQLKIYGQSIFKTGYFTLKENSDRIIAPPSYVIGTGDKVSVTIWGGSEFSDEFILDEYGNITPKLVGRISLKGKTFAQVKQIIKSRFGKVYNLGSSKIAINLTYSKVISVNIVGEVNNPGTYNIPSINSAFNLVSLANGLTPLGSVRTIEIRRQGKIINKLDLYHFLNSPSKYSNQYLQDGDFIVVKPYSGTITLRGEIKRPGTYEITPNEKLEDLLSLAGGFQNLADQEAINIIRIENNELMFHSYDFAAIQQNKFEVNSGDIINILRISDFVKGMVEIRGAINIPGEYKFTVGMKVNDLVNLANGTNRTTYLNHAQIFRTNKNMVQEIIQVNLESILENPESEMNIILNEYDVLKLFSSENFKEQSLVYAKGAINRTGEVGFLEGMNLKDLILEFNGLKKQADVQKIQVERVLFQKLDSSQSYVKIINLQYPKDEKFKLSRNDIVNFRTLPQFQFQKTVKIIGEVKYPGEYTLSGHNDQLLEIIERAGGLTDWAFLSGAQLNRNHNNLGLLLMDLKHTLNKKNSKFNYILKEGDIITIPKISNIVSITGAIGYKNITENKNMVNSPLHKNRRAGYYIKKYGGGYDNKAQRNKVYVISSNGMVKKSRFMGLIKPAVLAGDKVVVNFKELKKKKEKTGEPVNWNRVIENTSIKLTGILTLLILANSAFN